MDNGELPGSTELEAIMTSSGMKRDALRPGWLDTRQFRPVANRKGGSSTKNAVADPLVLPGSVSYQ